MTVNLDKYRLFVFACILCAIQSVDAAKIFVKHGKKGVILSAIASAFAGDTIIVGPGHYKEGNISITKPLRLIGKGQPILDGEYKVELITITANDVTVSGFRLEHTAVGSMEDYAAIRILSSDRVIIENNEGNQNFFGFHFSKSSDCIVRNNHLKNQPDPSGQLGNGIHLWKCEKFKIEGNKIEGHRDGIYFEFVTASSITRNYSLNNMRYGLHFMFSHDNRYIDNRFENNGAGVAVMYSARVIMIGNRFEKNWGPSAYGLLLKDIRDSEVRDNLFDRNTAGIYMEGSSRMIFSQNQFANNGWAVRIQASCDDNTFEKSNFFSNTFDVSTNGSLLLNRFDGNYWDRYEGYDLNRDGKGDIPFHPMNFFSMVVERMPTLMFLWRSFFVQMLDRAEKIIPVLTPEALRDNYPSIKPYDLLKSN